MPAAILLIDMDAFYASIEQARRPELRGQPIIVGGAAERRGVVSTASYEARACGVHTAMPTAQALRLCPQAVFLSVDMQAYLAVQQTLLAIFGRFTDLVEPVSIDEAFLDVSGSRRLFGPPAKIAADIQRAIREEQQLSCSIGIGPTKLLAKLAAEQHKPGGIGTLTEDDVHGSLRALPVGKISGIGPVTQRRLQAMGITTVGLLQDVGPSLLVAAFGDVADTLKKLAFGGPTDSVGSGHAPPKSLGHEVTFASDIDDPELLRATLLDLGDAVVAGLRRQGYAARTVTLKLRYESFQTISRQVSLPVPVRSTRPVFEAARALLDAVDLRGRKVRLLGLSVSNLSAAGSQLSLEDPWREIALDEAVDRVRVKYGARSLRLAGSELAPYAQTTSEQQDERGVPS
jgi:DNA polymerase IV